MTTLFEADGLALPLDSSSSSSDVAVESNSLEISPETAAAAEPNGFATLGLVSPLLASVASMGFTQPTPVQAQAVPAAMAGGDWMVSSQTGSGKTAAFLLPVLQRLLSAPAAAESRVSTPRAIVLCPTRELAQQVCADAIELMRGVVIALKTSGKHDGFKQSARGLRVANVVGGVPYGKQIFDLRGAQLVIATPGRLLDLHERGQIRLDEVQALVVDEADRMLDLGFADDLAAIHDLTSQRDQTLMYSATFAPRIMQLASRVMRDPQRLALASAQDRHADITQTLHWADNLAHKERLLDHWLRDVAMDQAVVFASTQADTETIAESLQQKGHAAVALHGAMPQSTRNRRLQNLRDGHVRVLVATDVAARGIDVPSISHVINFGLPMKAEDYVHRIGRTGRAGRSGTAVTIAEHRERHKIRQIEQYTNQPMAASEIAGLEPQIRPQARPAGGPRRGGPAGNRGGFRGNGGGHGGGQGGFGGQRGGDNRFAPRDGGEQRFAPRGDERFAPRGDERFAPRDGGFRGQDTRFAPRDGGGFRGQGQGHGHGGQRREGGATSGFAKAPRTAPRKSGFGSR